MAYEQQAPQRQKMVKEMREQVAERIQKRETREATLKTRKAAQKQEYEAKKVSKKRAVQKMKDAQTKLQRKQAAKRVHVLQQWLAKRKRTVKREQHSERHGQTSVEEQPTGVDAKTDHEQKSRPRYRRREAEKQRKHKARQVKLHEEGSHE